MPRAKRDFVRTNTYISKAQDEILGKLAHMLESTKAEITRTAISEYLHREAKSITTEYMKKQEELTQALDKANIG